MTITAQLKEKNKKRGFLWIYWLCLIDHSPNKSIFHITFICYRTSTSATFPSPLTGIINTHNLIRKHQLLSTRTIRNITAARPAMGSNSSSPSISIIVIDTVRTCLPPQSHVAWNGIHSSSSCLADDWARVMGERGDPRKVSLLHVVQGKHRA